MPDSRVVGGTLLAILGVLAGCGSSGTREGRKPLSARAQESTLATSKLPGAAGVGAALRVSDSATARRKREAEVDPP